MQGSNRFVIWKIISSLLLVCFKYVSFCGVGGCMCWHVVHWHAQAVLKGLSTAAFTVTHFLCFRSFSFLVDSRDVKKIPVFWYTSYLSSSRLWGTWTVIPAENNTSFSPVKPSVRAHHREQALKIRDIISLPGRLVHSIFPTTLHRGKVRHSGAQKGEK